MAVRRRVPHAGNDFAHGRRAGALPDVLNAEVGKRLGLPTQAYMALSDAKLLDAQAGAETFGSALRPRSALSTPSLAPACLILSWCSACPS